MYISKKKTYKILAYCAMSAVFVGGNVAFAYSADDEVEPSEYNNKVEVTMADGVSLGYPTNVRNVPFSGSSNIQSLEITFGDIDKIISGEAQLKDQTEGLTSAVVDSASLLDSGTDRLLEWAAVR